MRGQRRRLDETTRKLYFPSGRARRRSQRNYLLRLAARRRPARARTVLHGPARACPPPARTRHARSAARRDGQPCPPPGRPAGQLVVRSVNRPDTARFRARPARRRIVKSRLHLRDAAGSSQHPAAAVTYVSQIDTHSSAVSSRDISRPN